MSTKKSAHASCAKSTKKFGRKAAAPSDDAGASATADATGTPPPAQSGAGTPPAQSAPDRNIAIRGGSSTIGRIPIMEVTPQIEGGRLAAKGTEGESFPVQATIFREGHDKFAAEAVLVAPDGCEVQTSPMELIRPGLGRYEAWLTPTYPGAWSFFVRSWSDPYASWLHGAEIKMEAGIDVPLVLLEAAALLKRAAANAPAASSARSIFDDAAAAVSDTSRTPLARFQTAISAEVRGALTEAPLRDLVTESQRLPLNVDRIRALAGSWYEIFPRSTGATRNPDGSWNSGTLRTAAAELDRIAAMGFDVVYLTPIHPIGTENRKGRNNTLIAEPGDPGSPYAIGAAEGGHDAIHPDLGTFEDFDFFVSQARTRGMEVALDIALQCSPDHPWLTEHPEWFTTRADGTIAYAENPPKKYQDIYPLNFDNDPEGIYNEIKRVLEVWISHGVTIFRVDNPHTKPVEFWERLLAEFRIIHPEILFLAEAFTVPPMMHGLGAVGFHQSYTYFAWRNEKQEIEEYLLELASESDALMRPAFWPTTHDILTPYMQRGGVAAFAIRAILAATGSPTWGIYSGYELVENVARPGAEEQIDNEKYEFKARDYAAGEFTGIPKLLTRLNEIRKAHPALQRLRNIAINGSTNDHITSFTRWARPEETPDGKGDAVIVVVNLDPYATRDSELSLDLTPLGASPRWDGAAFLDVTDLLTGQTYEWNDHPYVRLDPHGNCAHILSVKVR